MTLSDRLTTRALLYAAPDTVVSVDEVAFALGRSKDAVRSARPASAYTAGGRAIVAPWSDWLEALGYGTQRGSGGARGTDRDADAGTRPEAGRAPLLADPGPRAADGGDWVVDPGRGGRRARCRADSSEDSPRPLRGRGHRG